MASRRGQLDVMRRETPTAALKARRAEEAQAAKARSPLAQEVRSGPAASLFPLGPARPFKSQLLSWTCPCLSCPSLFLCLPCSFPCPLFLFP